jgi:hypothetical protein
MWPCLLCGHVCIICSLKVFTLPLLFQADSVRLGVVRMNIFLHCEYCNFPMIFHCLSGHFWSDFSVQRTFPMDFRQTNSKPTPENDQVQRKSNGHSQRKSDGSLTDSKHELLVISIINKKQSNSSNLINYTVYCTCHG